MKIGNPAGPPGAYHRRPDWFRLNRLFAYLRFAFPRWRQRRRAYAKVGTEAVVIGNVPHTSQVGDRSVAIGPTDSNGNVNLTKPMAVGYRARAGEGSISIGAYAGAGVAREDLVAELTKLGVPVVDIVSLLQAIRADQANGISPSSGTGETATMRTKLKSLWPEIAGGFIGGLIQSFPG